MNIWHKNFLHYSSRGGAGKETEWWNNVCVWPNGVVTMSDETVCVCLTQRCGDHERDETVCPTQWCGDHESDETVCVSDPMVWWPWEWWNNVCVWPNGVVTMRVMKQCVRPNGVVTRVMKLCVSDPMVWWREWWNSVCVRPSGVVTMRVMKQCVRPNGVVTMRVMKQCVWPNGVVTMRVMKQCVCLTQWCGDHESDETVYVSYPMVWWPWEWWKCPTQRCGDHESDETVCVCLTQRCGDHERDETVCLTQWCGDHESDETVCVCLTQRCGDHERDETVCVWPNSVVTMLMVKSVGRHHILKLQMCCAFGRTPTRPGWNRIKFVWPISLIWH